MTPGLSDGMIVPVICVFAQDPGPEMDVEARPRLGRSRLLEHRLDEVACPCLEEIRRPQQERAALVGTCLGPRLEGLGGRGDDGLDVRERRGRGGRRDPSGDGLAPVEEGAGRRGRRNPVDDEVHFHD
jgi:hypothetical protein